MNYDIDDDNDTEAYQLHRVYIHQCNWYVSTYCLIVLLALFFNKAAETILIVASNPNDVQAFR